MVSASHLELQIRESHLSVALRPAAGAGSVRAVRNERGESIASNKFEQCMARNSRATDATRSPLYAIWKQMRYRCGNPTHPDFKNYGGRGIKVCERWASFAAFCDDMGPRPEGTSLDRRDNDKSYDPNNCRWASPLVQSNNSRKNVSIEMNGQRLTVAQWTRHFGISREAVWKMARPADNGDGDVHRS